jgi:hypothetical protein
MTELLKMPLYWALFGLRMAWWKIRNAACDRALIMVRQGSYYDLELATRIFKSDIGEIYQYGQNGIAYVFHKPVSDQGNKRERDPFEIYEDERMLFVVDGEVITTPVAGTGVPMAESVLSEFNRGDAIDQALKSLRDTGSHFGLAQLKWWLLIGGIVIIGYVIYKYVLHGHIPGIGPGPTPTPAIPTPSPEPQPTFMPALLSWGSWLIQSI